MTDVLYRPDVVDGASAPQPAPDPRASRPPPVPEDTTGGGTAAIVLATLSAAAGAIHLAMAPAHLGESAVEGTGFLVAGWVQVGLAVELARGNRLRRGVLGSVAALGAALIALWALSRTAGLPVGPHAGHPARVTVVDLTAVALELALVAGALALLWRPRLAARSGAAALAVPAAIVVLASAVLATPAARDHAAHSHAGHRGHRTAAAPAPADDKGFSLLVNGHHHAAGPPADLDPATQARLDAQLAVTRQLVARYPTAAAAEAAGYERYGAFTPGLGSHYVKLPTDGVKGDIDRAELLEPVLIFDGTTPDARLAGFMYIAYNVRSAPAGFAGPNDRWHFHRSVCLTTRSDGGFDAPFGADQDVTRAMCDTVGGQWMGITQHMVHVWVVPGYENPRGVFAEANPKLPCPDGTYHQIPWREMGHRASTCRSG